MSSRTTGWRLWALGVVLWTMATVITWPTALSFDDGVGYVGQARLVLDGRLHPEIDSVGFWIDAPAGEIAKYPFFFPLLLAPLFLIHPLAVFGVGVGAVIGLSLLTARILDRWSGEPQWGLLVLAHPSFVMLSRTVVPDTLLCLVAVGAWWALQRKRRFGAAVLCALTVLVKPTGAPIVLTLLLASYLKRRRPAGGDWLRDARTYAAAGVLAGGVFVVLLNLAAAGSVGYAYRWAHVGRDELGLAHLSTSGVSHLRSLLLMPPLLAIGAWPLWRRRALGPLLAAAALVLSMSVYWFVDTGRSTLESWVLGPRLILPAVAFLLIGYADLGSLLVQRFRRLSKPLALALLLFAVATPAFIGQRHSAWLAPRRAARQVAEEQASRHGGVIGMNFGAFKAGLLTRFEVSWFEGAPDRADLFLCNTTSGSYRQPLPVPCRAEGFVVSEEIATYRILARRPAD